MNPGTGKRIFAWVSVGVALLAACAVLLWRSAPHGWPADIPVLMYHRIADDPSDFWSVAPRDFESQLAFLKTNGFHTILPSDLIPARGAAVRLPARPVILTFDDGDLTTLTAAEPLLRQYGFRAIAYLITDAVAPTPDHRRSCEEHPYLTWSEVREMRSRGTFAFGGHSRHHIRLNLLSDPTTEIAGCFDDIRANAGFAPDSFSYPFGVCGRTVIRAVARAGFSTAVTANEKTARLGWSFDALAIPRLWVRGGEHTFAANQIRPTSNGELSFEVVHTGISIPISGRVFSGRPPTDTAPPANTNDVRQVDEWRPPEYLPPGRQTWTFHLTPPGSQSEAISLEIWDRNRFFRLYSNADQRR